MVYLSLPDTRRLLYGITLERTTSDGKIFKFLAGPKNKKYVPLNQVPRHLQYAVLALEDGRFYQHNGFDYEEIGHSILDSLKRAKRLRGASTLSQQLAKNLYLSSERTLRRKVIEAFITLKLEMTLPKNKNIRSLFE